MHGFDKAAVLQALQQQPFAPAWWARSGLMQTLASAYGRGPTQPLRLERWELPDRDFVRLHFADPAPAAPLVLLLHGLEGSARSSYVAAMLRAACAAGFGLVVLEFRSCGGELNRARRTYHSGETGDLGYVVERLRLRWPQRPLFTIGYSLGGNVLLKWLGECGELVPDEVLGAVAVSTPFDLAATAQRCDQRYGGVIARHFLRTLVPKAIAKERQFRGIYDPAAVRRCRSFAAFDDLVTAPLHGFHDARHYWSSQSCAPFLTGIRRPTLLLAAADDPLVPAEVFPYDIAATSPFLVPLLAPRGGHVGFIGGSNPLQPRRWAETQALRFFALCRDRAIANAPAPPAG